MKSEPLKFLVVLAGLLLICGLAPVAMAEDCADPKTQTDMNACSYANLDSETKKLNKTYGDLIAKLNPEQKQLIKQAQLAWIKFKDLSCKYEASGVKGGSAYPLILSDCLAAKTQQRNKELEALSHCQEGDLSCPAWQ